jgi:hypothetical protein
VIAQPDPKGPPRVKDSVLLTILHREWRECVLCGEHRGKLSLHHIHKHPRDDVRPNLVMLCGDGVSGCHGAIEAGDRPTREKLGIYIVMMRLDVIQYLNAKLGGETQADAWLERNLLVEPRVR